MAIEITSGGVTKTYRYYPYDVFYANGQQVKEAWLNGVKYYPDEYPDGIVALRGIERHPAGVSHPMPSPRYAICSEVYNQGSYELDQYAMGSFEISWAYLGVLRDGRNFNDAVIQSNNGGFDVIGDHINKDQYIFYIKYVPNKVVRSDLRQDSYSLFDAILNGTVISTSLIDRNHGMVYPPDYNYAIYVNPDYSYYTNFKIRVRFELNDGQTSYNSHHYWGVFFYIQSTLSNGVYNQGHERYVEIFKPNNTSSLIAADLLPPH